jgi:hypothetical protein
VAEGFQLVPGCFRGKCIVAIQATLVHDKFEEDPVENVLVASCDPAHVRQLNRLESIR